MRARRWFIVAVAVLVLMGALGWWSVRANDPLRSDARRQWTQQAIATVERSITTDAAALHADVARLTARATTRPYDPPSWIGRRVIVLRNGDWIAYASICSKQDPRIVDQFIGRGSDGKWYCSTYHFCTNMVGLAMDEPTPSLAEFVKLYALREFDGGSNECLSRTWPSN
jgi:hypothetical protein